MAVNKGVSIVKCKPCQAVRIKKILAQLRANNKEEQKYRITHYIKNSILYVKVFLISDKRNNNGWRANWDSIKRKAKTFIGKPGIEYFKCGVHGCRRDHTELKKAYYKGQEEEYYKDSLTHQEKYRVTTIRDIIFDETTHTAYAIHEVHDKEFARKIQSGEILYTSPSIHATSEKTTMYLNKDDEMYIDTTDWKGVHSAWINQPAYNHEARIVNNCIGDDSCIAKLKKDTNNNEQLDNDGGGNMIKLNANTKYRILKIIHQLKATSINGQEVKSWITVKGQHIPVFEGETAEDAGERFILEQGKSKGEVKQMHKEKAEKETKEKTDNQNKKINSYTFEQLNTEIKHLSKMEDNASEKYKKEYNDKMWNLIEKQKEKFPVESKKQSEKRLKEMQNEKHEKPGTPGKYLTESMSWSEFQDAADDNDDFDITYDDYKQHMRNYYTERKKEVPLKWN